MGKWEEVITKKRKIDSTTITIPWEDLPHHLLELFLNPISESIERPNMTRVSKAWRDFQSPKSCFPELVHDSSIIFNRLFSGDEFDDYPIRSCVGSSHGWLIIRMGREKHGDDDDVQTIELYYLLNIFTKDTIQLPILWNVTPVYPKVYLSSAPTDPDCIIWMFDASFRGFLFSKRGCNKWIESECDVKALVFHILSIAGSSDLSFDDRNCEAVVGMHPLP